MRSLILIIGVVFAAMPAVAQQPRTELVPFRFEYSVDSDFPLQQSDIEKDIKLFLEQYGVWPYFQSPGFTSRIVLKLWALKVETGDITRGFAIAVNARTEFYPFLDREGWIGGVAAVWDTNDALTLASLQEVEDSTLRIVHRAVRDSLSKYRNMVEYLKTEVVPEGDSER